MNYCMFFGYPYSGHSLIGALLDAHPEMVISHELHALQYIHQGITWEELQQKILQRSRWFAEQNNKWNGYPYHVKGQWQGRYRTLKVIGDKKGGRSTETLQQHSGLLNTMLHHFPVPVQFLHVTRSPIDLICGLAAHHDIPLTQAEQKYLHYATINRAILTQIPQEDVRVISLESFAKNPQKGLQHLCRFFQVDPSADYLTACADIVQNPIPHRREEFLPAEITALQERYA